MSEHVLKGYDGVMKALEDIAKKMGSGSVSVGFINGATYPDGELVAGVAFKNEYGVPENHQPPRPFFRRMIAKESPAWPAKLASALQHTNYDSDKALALMGEDIKGGLVQSINEFQTPGLAKYTIKKKGFSKPLIDTSQMINSITYKVDN